MIWDIITDIQIILNGSQIQSMSLRNQSASIAGQLWSLLLPERNIVPEKKILPVMMIE
jgi:hypothetical protein